VSSSSPRSTARQRGGAVDVYTTLTCTCSGSRTTASARGSPAWTNCSRAASGASPAQAALVAVDPRTGEVLALVGGRSYNQSQFNRAMNARRQPGSVFKPFVYLAAFEQAGRPRARRHHAGVGRRRRADHFWFNRQTWTPGNYDGRVRRAGRAAPHARAVAQHPDDQARRARGYDRVARLWRQRGGGTAQPRAFPAITLGVFEASPFEIATAYTLFPNGGEMRPLRVLLRVTSGGRDLSVRVPAPRRIARADTAFLVTNMLRSVLTEGTGASARAAGFTRDAAGKSGTTNDLRDAWFVGFTPDLLTVVWVGLDDNQPLGLSGTQAALPIWTHFMIRATAGRPERTFAEPPVGITWVEIDRDTGSLATHGCPRVLREAFLDGTEPFEYCQLHQY
jgi:penicillin-binding protein 1B